MGKFLATLVVLIVASLLNHFEGLDIALILLLAMIYVEIADFKIESRERKR